MLLCGMSGIRLLLVLGITSGERGTCTCNVMSLTWGLVGLVGSKRT